MSSFLKPIRRKAAFNVFSDIQRATERTEGNRNVPWPVKCRSSLRIANTRAAKGTRCGLRVFILRRGISQSAASTANSAHSAARSSPGRTKVRASNSRGGSCFRRTLIISTGAQQPAKGVRCDDCRPRRHRWSNERATQGGGGIVLGASGGDGVAENVAYRGSKLAGSFVNATRLYLLKDH